MTPAIKILIKEKLSYVIHKFTHRVSNQAYGMEAVEKLGVDKRQVYKTLVVVLDAQELAVAVIPVAMMLSMKLLAKQLNAKKIALADKEAVERSTGYIVGGISPIGQKRALRTVIDSSALLLNTIFVSAGKRGLELELSPADLQQLTRAHYANICQ